MLIGGCTGVLQQMRLHHVKPNIKTFTQLLDQIPSTFHAEEVRLDRDSKDSLKLMYM